MDRGSSQTIQLLTTVVLNDTWSVADSDGGHGDILRIAFAQYHKEVGEVRFSQHMIDWIIRNNYHSDAHPNNADGAGQYNTANHFDNPNEGPMYLEEVDLDSLDVFDKRKDSYKDGNNDFWIADAVAQIGNNRSKYTAANGNDISGILAAFGQNSHALADFYAHSNWVDSKERGGWMENWELGQSQKECGWIPPGLEMTRVWNDETDDVTYAYLFSGSAHSAHETLFDTKNEASHAYWNKDKASTDAGKQAYTNAEIENFESNGMYFWQVQTYDPDKPVTDDAGKP